MRSVGALVYPNFELLDLFGPLEMFGWLGSEFELVTIGPRRGPVASNMGVETVAQIAFDERADFDLLLVPGGWGRTIPVDAGALVPWLAEAADRSGHVLAVCTGSAILSLTGRLDGLAATTNKALFHWVAEKRPQVQWRAQARWVRDGRFSTSSGVSAGIDMALATIADLLGSDAAGEVAVGCEYTWHPDPDHDPFAQRYGLA